MLIRHKRQGPNSDGAANKQLSRVMTSCPWLEADKPARSGEKGTNRASAGRLQEIAGVLGVPLISFFDDVTGEDGPVPGEILSGLKQHGAADLLRVYTSIRSPELRRSLVQIARELAGTEGRALGPAIASAARRKGREARLA